jgi:hypothetical protein
VKLKYLDRWTEGRQRNAALYRQEIRCAQLPVERPGGRHIYNPFVIRSSKRDEPIAHLRQKGIASEVYFPVPLHLQTCFAESSYRKGMFPVSEQAAETTLALPIYPELTPETIHKLLLSIPWLDDIEIASEAAKIALNTGTLLTKARQLCHIVTHEDHLNPGTAREDGRIHP